VAGRERVAGIVLAAGSSTRLGRPKQLLDLAGKSVLQHVLDAAAASPLEEMVVVLGHAAEDVAATVRLPAHAGLVINAEFQEGQSTSMKAGLRAVGPGTAAAVFLLGDQPGVRSDVIAAVIEAYRGGAGPVVQASYRGRPAHPTLFDRGVWEELEAATGDEGARGILARHPDWRSTVEVGGDPPADIDTEQDYAAARRRFEAQSP
jgi:molybdenum cofactor cytidylyltransferase